MTCPRAHSSKAVEGETKPYLTVDIMLHLHALCPAWVGHLEWPLGSWQEAQPTRVQRPEFQPSQPPKQPCGSGQVPDSPWTLDTSPSNEGLDKRKEGRLMSSSHQDHEQGRFRLPLSST